MTQTTLAKLRLMAMMAAFGIVAATAGQAQAQKAVTPALAVQNLNIAKINPSVLKSLGNLNGGGVVSTNIAGVPAGNAGKGSDGGDYPRTTIPDGNPGRDVPRRTKDDPKDTPVVERPGEQRNLGQLQSVSSIGQLASAPLQHSFEAPRQAVLNKLENRQTASLAAGLKPATAAGRDQALQALDGAKPLI